MKEPLPDTTQDGQHQGEAIFCALLAGWLAYLVYVKMHDFEVK